MRPSKHNRLTVVIIIISGIAILSQGCKRAGQETTDIREPANARYGSVIMLKADKMDEYKRLHADVWPDVLKIIRECNIRNYSIYLKELELGKFYLFSYFEYTGTDFQADIAKMAADPITQKWWKLTDPCQTPLPMRGENEWWATMEEVFHTE